jgi:PPM family protein phosphatase
MKIVAGNAQHIGARQEQQDSFRFSDPRNEEFMSHGGFLGVVADGMGGLSHGSEASHAAVRAFLLTYESKAPSESIPDALARSLIAANQTVVALADRVGSANGTGTTLAAAVLHGDSLYWISAGDSRVYLCHGNSLTRITTDHVYARQLNEKVARGVISRAEAQQNSERAALTSFLGDLKEVDRSLRPRALRKGDGVILCSDGLYRALSEAEIIEAFQGDPQSACDTLVRQAVAKQRNQQDNLTIIAMSNGAGPVEAHAILRRAVLILAGALLLAAIGGGIYARRNHLRSLKTAVPARPNDNAAAPVSSPAAPPGGPSTPMPQSPLVVGSGAGSAKHAGPPASSGTTGNSSKPSAPARNAARASGAQASQGQARTGKGTQPSGPLQRRQSTPSRHAAPSTPNGSVTTPSTPPQGSETQPEGPVPAQEGQGTTTGQSPPGPTNGSVQPQGAQNTTPGQAVPSTPNGLGVAPPSKTPQTDPSVPKKQPTEPPSPSPPSSASSPEGS